MSVHRTTHSRDQRYRQALARLRQKQLALARQGRVADSARYADRANRVRAVLLPCGG